MIEWKNGSSQVIWRPGQDFEPKRVDNSLAIASSEFDDPNFLHGFRWDFADSGRFRTNLAPTIEFFPSICFANVRFFDSRRECHKREFNVDNLKVISTKRASGLSIGQTQNGGTDRIDIHANGRIYEYHRLFIADNQTNNSVVSTNGRVLTVNETAAILGCTRANIGQMIDRGTLAARR